MTRLARQEYAAALRERPGDPPTLHPEPARASRIFSEITRQ